MKELGASKRQIFRIVSTYDRFQGNLFDSCETSYVFFWFVDS